MTIVCVILNLKGDDYYMSRQLVLSDVIWSNIKRLQYVEHISDSKLAEMMDVSRRTIQNYEKYPERITLDKLRKLVDYLGIDPVELIK